MFQYKWMHTHYHGSRSKLNSHNNDCIIRSSYPSWKVIHSGYSGRICFQGHVVSDQGRVTNGVNCTRAFVSHQTTFTLNKIFEAESWSSNRLDDGRAHSLEINIEIENRKSLRENIFNFDLEEYIYFLSFLLICSCVCHVFIWICRLQSRELNIH